MKKSVILKIGWIFIFLACISWISLIVIPFLSLSFTLKAMSATACVVLGEVFFWIGTLFIGKEVFQTFKKS